MQEMAIGMGFLGTLLQVTDREKLFDDPDELAEMSSAMESSSANLARASVAFENLPSWAPANSTVYHVRQVIDALREGYDSLRHALDLRDSSLMTGALLTASRSGREMDLFSAAIVTLRSDYPGFNCPGVAVPTPGVAVPSSPATVPTPASTSTPTRTPASVKAVTVKGTGSRNTKPFELKAGDFVVTMTGVGDGNVIVRLYPRDGGILESEGLFNEISYKKYRYETVVYGLAGGSYYLDVSADNAWVVKFAPLK